MFEICSFISLCQTPAPFFLSVNKWSKKIYAMLISYNMQLLPAIDNMFLKLLSQSVMNHKGWSDISLVFKLLGLSQKKRRKNDSSW